MLRLDGVSYAVPPVALHQDSLTVASEKVEIVRKNPELAKNSEIIGRSLRELFLPGDEIRMGRRMCVAGSNFSPEQLARFNFSASVRAVLQLGGAENLEQQMSRHHLRVQVTEQGLTLYDGWNAETPSSNGVYCNGTRVNGSIALKKGDVVAAGLRAPGTMLELFEVPDLTALEARLKYCSFRPAPPAEPYDGLTIAGQRLPKSPDDTGS